MPNFLESKLKQEYPGNDNAVYGTMNKIGAMHGNKITPKGRDMERKHAAKIKPMALGGVAGADRPWWELPEEEDQPVMPQMEMDPTQPPPQPNLRTPLSRLAPPQMEPPDAPPNMGGAVAPPSMDAAPAREAMPDMDRLEAQEQGPSEGGMRQPSSRQRVTTPQTTKLISDAQQVMQAKPKPWQQVLGGVLSAFPTTRRIDVHPAITRQRQNLDVQQMLADEERKGQVAQAQEAYHQEATEAAKEGRLASVAQRMAAARAQPGTPAQQVALWKQAGYSDEQAMQIVAAGGKLQPPKPTPPQRPISVAPGGTLVDPATGKPMFTAEERTPKNTKAEDIEETVAAKEQIANKRGLKGAERQHFIYGTPMPAAQSGTGPSGPPVDIKPGSREFKIAQDLAYGKLTMQQFRSMLSYSRDVNKKMDIYSKASDLNPNFNPSTFEMGFTLAKNPKVQQQLAAMDNVQAGIPDLLKASDEAKRSGVTMLNKFIIPGGIAFGSKKYSNLAAARLGFADELSGALGFGSATDMSRQMGLDMTNPNLSHENFMSAVQDVVLPFVQRKRATLLKQMGIYGEQGMNPAAEQAPPEKPQSGGGQQGGGAQGGMIRVKRKSDGQPGSIPAANFDPAKYDKL